MKRDACNKIIGAFLVFAGIGASEAAFANDDTQISSQIFTNFSNVQVADMRSDREGWQIDLKRFYLNLDHQFNADWKLKLTTDVQWQRQQDPTDVWFRHAYLEHRVNKQQTLKLGVAELPWIDYIARRVGYRYIDPSLNPKNQFAGPTDLGVHYSINTDDFTVAAAAISGGGFKKPRIGERVDFELTGVWHVLPGLDVATGWYEGTRTQDKDENPKYHHAQRWNFALSYLLNNTRFGVEYAYNDNWTRVSQLAPDASDGWSVWASYGFKPGYSAFIRYDVSHPSRRLNPELKQDYFQLGVDWKATRFVTVALVAKKTEIDSLIIDQQQHEIGLWTMWNF